MHCFSVDGSPGKRLKTLMPFLVAFNVVDSRKRRHKKYAFSKDGSRVVD